jgi:ribosome maturation factor RimP
LVDLDRTKALIQEIVAAEGLELVDVEFKGGLNHRILRIYIDKPAGVTHADCQRVSEQVGTDSTLGLVRRLHVEYLHLD